jgi:hypothetical protein
MPCFIAKKDIVSAELLIDLLRLHKRLCEDWQTDRKAVKSLSRLERKILSFAKEHFNEVIDFGSKDYSGWCEQPPQYLEHLLRPIVFLKPKVPEGGPGQEDD